jgi:hypothetical protein
MSADDPRLTTWASRPVVSYLWCTRLQAPGVSSRFFLKGQAKREKGKAAAKPKPIFGLFCSETATKSRFLTLGTPRISCGRSVSLTDSMASAPPSSGSLQRLRYPNTWPVGTPVPATDLSCLIGIATPAPMTGTSLSPTPSGPLAGVAAG